MLPQKCVVSVAVLFMLAGVPVWSGDKKSDTQKAIDAVRKYIDDKGAKGGGDITVKAEDALKKVFPDYQFINARFRQFPIARISPEGMNASNIFAVNKDGKLEYLKDAKALEKFFNVNQSAAKNDTDAKLILGAWLTLTQEFHQDGMFKFEVLDKEFKVADKKVSGRITVMQGGNGTLSADLTLDKDGKLAKVEEKAAIRAGPRPICQATKLLDADPIVRRIAEQDLLIMGISARDYLMEQSDRATPELRQAIDRLWQQIQKNGW